MIDENIEISKRNIDYVVSLVNEQPGKLDLFELIKQTRLKHSLDDPLGLKDAREAVEAAIKKRLIEIRPGQGYLYQNKPFYYSLN